MGSIQDYVDQFSVLVDQLATYISDADPLYYAMRFVDGLQDDIKSMVVIQWPSTLDSACSLALVQEEAMELGRKREFKRYDSSSNRAIPQTAFPLPPPHKHDKPSGVTTADDKCQNEVAKLHVADDKLRALKQYHRARGL
jgi:hypothetical protein